MANEINELEDRWILPLRGSQVTHVDWGDSARFRLEPPGEIAVGFGALLSHGPRSAPGAQARTLGELGQEEVQRAVGTHVLSAVGFKNGALRIVFDNGWHLNVRAAEPFVPASVTSGDSVSWSRPVG
jgi:Family of unknown function (DUF6188)